MDDRSASVSAVAALAEPTRRRLYDHVVAQPDPVSRDEAAEAVAVPRATAAFHLDRLVDDGLLEVQFERRSGRTGPGAGRPAKLYRRADCTVEVSFPERHYDLAGDLLAAAMAESGESGESPRSALARLAYERGRQLGSEAPPGEGRTAALRVLEDHALEQPQVHAADQLGVLARQAVERAVGERDRAVLRPRFEAVVLEHAQGPRAPVAYRSLVRQPTSPLVGQAGQS